jgi:protein-S-isoprenylcysteine O-methyltransferase Ste14
MDEHDRETFKHQFIKLTLLLNAIVLFVAFGAFVLVIVHSLPGIAAGLGLLAAGVIVFLYTWRLYQETREWLEVNAGSGEEKH